MSIELYRHDCERIRNAARQNGIEITLQQAYDLWDDHSDSYAAGWLGLPEDDDILWQEIGSRARDMYEERLINALAHFHCCECDEWIPQEGEFCPWCGVKQ